MLSCVIFVVTSSDVLRFIYKELLSIFCIVVMRVIVCNAIPYLFLTQFSYDRSLTNGSLHLANISKRKEIQDNPILGLRSLFRGDFALQSLDLNIKLTLTTL